MMTKHFRKYTLCLSFPFFFASCEKKEISKDDVEERETVSKKTKEPPHLTGRISIESDYPDSSNKAPNLDGSPQLPAPIRSGKPRMPKVQNFDNIPEPEIDEDLQKFSKIFEGLKPSSKAYQEQYKASWEEIVTKYFDSPIDDDSLPTIEALMKQAHAIILKGRVEKDELGFALNEREKLSGRQLTWLATLDSMSGGHQLSSNLQNRADNWPPTNLDLAILYASLQGMRELNPSTNKPILEDWSAMAKAKNPIYRLIALKASVASTPREALHLSTEDPAYNKAIIPGKAQFYEKYIDERNTLILSELISSIQTSPSKESMEVLEKLRKNPIVKQNVELQEALETSRKSFKNYLK